MVLIQWATPTKATGAYPPSPMQLPMGDNAGYSSSSQWQSYTQPPPSPFRATSKKFSFNSTWKPQKWFVVLIYVAAAVSWIMAIRLNAQANELITDLRSQEQTQKFQMQQEFKTYGETKSEAAKSKKQITKLKKARLYLEHEIRVLQALTADGEQMAIAPPRGADERIVRSWLGHRQAKLQHKIQSMQQFLQEESRQSVLAKHGPGPHNVKFTVAYTDPDDRKSTVSFVVEMASLDIMPHSVDFFLEMIGSKIWDNTVFLHHEQVEHVLAAAPIDYKTQTVKHHHLNYFGWQGLGFPEYSKKHPHKRYTIGFAGKGPTFYINTLDNSDAHGPGGQGHHALDGDADPCFGTVIEGIEVVDLLFLHGLNQSKMRESKEHPWADDEHTWSHIVKIEIM
jgi:hypothetical protein